MNLGAGSSLLDSKDADGDLTATASSIDTHGLGSADGRAPLTGS